MEARGASFRFRLEREVDAPSELVWRSLVAMLDRSVVETDETGAHATPRPSEVGGETRFRLDNWHLAERTTVAASPSRREYEIVKGAPVVSYRGITVLSDVNDGCRITWTVEAEPAPGRELEFDAFIERAELAVTRGLDMLTAAIPSLDDPLSRRFVIERHLTVEPQRVWEAIVELYADADYSELSPAEPAYGRGAIIRYRYGDWAQHAAVAVWRPPRHRAYEMLDGAPVRRYRGMTTVTPDASGSILRWECVFVLDDEDHSEEYRRLAEATVGRAVDRVAARAVAAPG
jgi:polyketide cyclase/dehydrase/lipid transport protein